MGVSGKGLSNNAGLVPLSLGLQLAACLVCVPLILNCIAAVMNGQLAYNGARADGGTAQQTAQCVDQDGQQVGRGRVHVCA